MKTKAIALLLTLSVCFGMTIPAFGLSSKTQTANTDFDSLAAESNTVNTIPTNQIKSVCQYDAERCSLAPEVSAWISGQYPGIVFENITDSTRLYASVKQRGPELIRNAVANMDRSVQVPSAEYARSLRSSAVVSTESELAAACVNTSVDIILITANIQLTDTLPINHSVIMMSLSGSLSIIAASGKRHFSITNLSSPISVTFSNVTLDGDEVGGGIIINNSYVTLNGAVITNCAENGSCNGSAVLAYNNAINPGTNEMQASGSLTINGGSFTYNQTDDGSAISVSGPISIVGAEISHNTGRGVSAINFVESGAAAYFESVTICYNEAETRGGGLHLTGYSVTITGTANQNSVISHNTAQYGGGGVFAYLCSTSVQHTTFESNTIEYVEPSVRTVDPDTVGGAGIMNVGALSVDKSNVLSNSGDCDCGFGVGIFALHPRILLGSSYDPDDSPWIGDELTVSDSVIQGNTCLWATGQNPYDRSMNGGGLAVIELKPKLTNTEISENEALVGGGALIFYAYDEDDLGPNDDPVIYFSGITVEDNTGKLAGGGIAVIGPDIEDNNEDVLSSTLKCKLQLDKYEPEDNVTAETLTTISGNKSRYGAGVTTFTVELTVTDDTVIQSNVANSTFPSLAGNDWPNWACAGAGVLLAEQSKLDLSDGEILENTTLKSANQQSAGAGIYAMGASEVLVHGASAVSTNGFHVEDVDDLTNRTSTSVDTMFGGGIYTEAATTTSVSGGSVHGNASSYGAGIYCCGDLDVSGGEISENTSVQSGGVYTQSTGTLSISGGDICENTALNGAGVYTTAPMTFTGGIVQENVASALGGGVYATNTVSMTGQYENGICVDGIISGNEALYGGGVYYNGYKTTWTMNSGSIRYNTATTFGGGVFATGIKAVWKMDGGIIELNDNEEGNGGGIYTECDMILTGGTIAQNYALGSDCHGGGIYIAAPASVANNGCTITRNQSSGVGGGVYVKRGASYTENYDSYVTMNTPDNIFWE